MLVHHELGIFYYEKSLRMNPPTSLIFNCVNTCVQMVNSLSHETGFSKSIKFAVELIFILDYHCNNYNWDEEVQSNLSLARLQ